MTLLLTLLAAVITSVIWYVSKQARKLYIGTLSLMFWGAGLMWSVDAIYEYIDLGTQYFTPSVKTMLNDTFLGISVIVLGLIIWFAIVFFKDPHHVIAKSIKKGE